MQKLFEYNWQVRQDWFNWCQDVPLEELLKKRTGGVGGILHTLFHIVVVEYSWICDMKGKPDFREPFDSYASLQQVMELSHRFHEDIRAFVASWTDELEWNVFSETTPKGETVSFKYGEIMRHVIAHEIHHVGQLSVWSRELNKVPVTANLIRRGLY
ncbi:DinB family protein [Paenibacillus glycanilyticus]|uniref:DinB family protein n=1 Tax=Paenibacillus glycanilyticus TaxID=126569 RepID=UPI00203AA5E5|nr:DinB family protein [Paenibacillus glycanilyticus]MCM3628376.1 DinB family protein [Paenibacillus glycanilyticus]